MKKFISSPERKKLTLSIMMKLKSLRVSIPNKIEYLLDRVKKLPSFIFSMTRSIGGDLKDLAKHIRQEGIPIKRLSRFLISLPSRLFEDLKSTKRISSYISISVVGAIGLVLLIIVTLDCVGAMIDGAGDVTAEYNFLQVLIYVALTVPGRIYEFLPTASLIGCLVGLGALANNSELIVFTHGSLGFEALSKGIRVVSFYSNFPEKSSCINYNRKGQFWSNSSNYSDFENLVKKVINYSDKEWNKIRKRFSGQIMFYDKNNKLKKKIISQIKNKNL